MPLWMVWKRTVWSFNSVQNNDWRFNWIVNDSYCCIVTTVSLRADSHAGVLSPNDSSCNWNWLTQTVCGTWLYNCLSSTCFLWAYESAPNSTTSTGQGDIPPDAPVSPFFCLFTQVHLLIVGSVEGQYVTIRYLKVFNFGDLWWIKLFKI